ncbi:MAG: hypothetical protein ACE5HX_04405, partial [bacterium]
PAGCHTVYRGQDGNLDYENIQAVMNLNASQVSIKAQNLPAKTIWHYIRRQVSDCGLESQDSPACIVIIDSNGDMIGNAPNKPQDLVAENVAGAKIKLRWRYSKLSEEITPTGFHIYIDSGLGFDWNLPDATVLYKMGGIAGEFSWTSAALTHGQIYRFCVRSYKTGVGESQNTDYVSAVADSQGPAAITNLQTSYQEI